MRTQNPGWRPGSKHDVSAMTGLRGDRLIEALEGLVAKGYLEPKGTDRNGEQLWTPTRAGEEALLIAQEEGAEVR